MRCLLGQFASKFNQKGVFLRRNDFKKKLENGVNPDACCGSQGIVMKMNHTSLEALRIEF